MSVLKTLSGYEMRFRRKLYASPGGGASMTTSETAHWSERPAKGDWNGLLEAQSLLNGSTPSRPSSWLMRPCEN